MAHNVKLAENSTDQIRSSWVRSKYLIIAESRDELNSPIRLEIQSTVDATGREDMGVLGESTIGDAIFTKYYDFSNCVNDYSFLLDYQAITDMIQSVVTN